MVYVFIIGASPLRKKKISDKHFVQIVLLYFVWLRYSWFINVLSDIYLYKKKRYDSKIDK